MVQLSCNPDFSDHPAFYPKVNRRAIIRILLVVGLLTPTAVKGYQLATVPTPSPSCHQAKGASLALDSNKEIRQDEALSFFAKTELTTPTPITQPSTKPHNTPAIVCNGDSYDLGYVKPKSKHYVDFVVNNPTDKALTIRKTRSECKCMKAVSPPKTIPAKESAIVRIEFIAPDETTRYSKRIVLQTTDKRRPIIAVRVKANVGLPLATDPQTVRLGDLIAGETRMGSTLIVNHGEQPVRIAYSTSNKLGCIALAPREAAEAGGELVVPLRVRTAATDSGTHKVDIRLHTNSNTQRQLSVRLEYSIDSTYIVSPGFIDLGGMAQGETRSISVTLQSTKASAKYSVRSCRFGNNDGLKGEARLKTDETNEATVDCTVKTIADSGRIAGQIEIKLVDRKQPVTIPLQGWIEPTTASASSTSASGDAS